MTKQKFRNAELEEPDPLPGKETQAYAKPRAEKARAVSGRQENVIGKNHGSFRSYEM